MAYFGEKQYIEKTNKAIEDADSGPVVNMDAEHDRRKEHSGRYDGIDKPSAPSGPYKDTLNYGDEKKPTATRKKIFGVF